MKSLMCLLQVMLGGKNIEEGFGIAYRVIQVCSFKTCLLALKHMCSLIDFFILQVANTNSQQPMKIQACQPTYIYPLSERKKSQFESPKNSISFPYCLPHHCREESISAGVIYLARVSNLAIF